MTAQEPTPMLELIHDSDKMADTIAYSCALPLKQKYRDPGGVPHMFNRHDFTNRDGSRKRQPDAVLAIPFLGFRASLKNHAITKVQCDLPKLLYGHNGRLIRSQEQVELALSRLEHILGLVSTTTSMFGGMVPGRPVHDHVHFTRIDFAWQFADPDLRLASMIRQAVHPNIRRQNCQYPNGTTLPGTQLKIKAYEKAAQLGIDASERYVRLEVQMTGKKLRKLFKGDEEAKVCTLDLMEIYKTYRTTLLELDQPAVAARGERATVAEALAQAQLAVPETDIITPWIEMRYSNRRSSRRFRKEITSVLQEASDFRFSDLLPAGRVPDPHELVVKKKEERLRSDFVLPFDWPTGAADPLAPGEQ